MGNTENTFFMVFLEGERTPTYKHDTLESAENEAKRLAKLHGKKAFVLVTVKSFELNEFIEMDCRPKEEEIYLPF